MSGETSTELADRISVGQRQFWREFLALYQQLPELWDTRHPSYRIRESKYEAYDALEAKLKEIEPKATRYEVQRRINIFRTNYRRERSRILKLEEMGLHPDVCKPTLWYYTHMMFLQTQETVMHNTRSYKFREPVDNLPAMITCRGGKRRHTVRTAETSLMSYKTDDTDDNSLLSPKIEILDQDMEAAAAQVDDAVSQLATQTIALDHKLHNPKIESFQQAVKNMEAEAIEPNEDINLTAADTSVSDHNDPTCSNSTTSSLVRNVRTSILSEATEALAKSWAIQYEEMAPLQRILARKAIADILFEGCMGNLRINHNANSN